MERVLIVDDEDGVRDSLEAILSDEGLEADAVATGEEGLELLSRNEYGAVLLDVWLPRLGGLEVLDAIGVGPGRPAVIMISGHGSIETAVRATRMGAFDFLEKPLSLEKVVLTVRNGLKQRRLEDQNRLLRQEVSGAGRLIGQSEPMRRLRREVAAVAAGGEPVLVRGETGAGKELVARAVHAAGPRSEEPFVMVHCAGIPEERFLAELLGMAGAGLGDAEEIPRGRLQLADGGTLFLNDLLRIPAGAVGPLAGFLETGTFRPVGSEMPLRADVRVLCSCRVEPGGAPAHLPEPLRGLLGATVIEVPPLRERIEDLEPLLEHFLSELLAHYGRGPLRVEPGSLDALRAYGWPGNVRELRNLAERLVITARGEQVGPEDLPPALGGVGADEDPMATGRGLREAREIFERQFIHRRLVEHDFNVTRTARALGLERSHLHRKIKALGLD